MAIPSSRGGERSRYLDAILDACPAERIPAWPEPTDQDYSVIGRLIVNFCNIDLHLRRMVEALDRGGKLPAKFHGKSAVLNEYKTREAVLGSLSWTAEQMIGFGNLDECRKFRNMAAHFAVKRFEDEDAFLFMTKSVSDFRQAFGVNPAPPKGLMCIIDGSEFLRVLDLSDALMEWVQQETYAIERVVGGVPRST
jgi:hypothetical protein